MVHYGNDVIDIHNDDAFNFREDMLDFRNAKAINLPFNVKTYMPEKLEINKEIKLQELKLRLKEVTKEYTRNNNTEMSNLKDDERRGIKTLIERRDNKEIVYFKQINRGSCV